MITSEIIKFNRVMVIILGLLSLQLVSMIEPLPAQILTSYNIDLDYNYL